MTTEALETAPSLRSTPRLRLRLKSAHRLCGHVQGAWWPHSTRLVAELPPLLDALASRLGPVDRLSYHDSDWSSAPRRSVLAGTDVVVNADEGTPHTVTAFGEQFGRVTLLVIPPYTDPSEAYTAVVTAANPTDTSTPDELLGIRPPRRKERKLARLALSRWETEGGALHSIGV
jgi:uncharacterized protein DUF5994